MLLRHIEEEEAANKLESAIAKHLAKSATGLSTDQIARSIFEGL
jgi:isocitrate/isopropylmalate dehydrogenase